MVRYDHLLFVGTGKEKADTRMDKVCRWALLFSNSFPGAKLRPPIFSDRTYSFIYPMRRRHH